MPPIEATQKPLPTNYVRVSPSSPMPPANQPWQPAYNVNQRCPVPPSNFTPDTAQQFYRGNTLPQFRAFAPSPLNSGAGSTTGGGGGTTTVIESSSSSVTNNYPTVQLSVKSASLTTPVLSQGQAYAGLTAVAASYILVGVSASSAARIRVYATATAQTLDISRTSAQAPAYGVTQGLIAGVSLNTSPFLWLFTPVPTGNNGDVPSTKNAYVTINNNAAMSLAITVSFQYIPLVS